MPTTELELREMSGKSHFAQSLRAFKYLVIPFELSNALATFQSYINRALVGLVDVCCVVYLDNILIFLDLEGDCGGELQREKLNFIWSGPWTVNWATPLSMYVQPQRRTVMRKKRKGIYLNGPSPPSYRHLYNLWWRIQLASAGEAFLAICYTLSLHLRIPLMHCMSIDVHACCMPYVHEWNGRAVTEIMRSTLD